MPKPETNLQLGISFRATSKTLPLVGNVASEYASMIDYLGVYDECGDLPPFLHLWEMAKNLPKNADTYLGVVGANVAKYKSMEDVVGYTAALSQIRPGKVLLGLVPGGNVEHVGLPKAPVDMMREAFLTTSYLLQKRETGFVGKYFNISPGFKMNYNPSGSFPLLLGAWGEKMSFLAGQVADIIEVGASTNPKVIPIIKDRIRLGAESVNRDPNDVSIIMGGFTFIDNDTLGAYKAAKKVIPFVISSAIRNDPSLTKDFPEHIKIITNLLRLNRYDEISAHIPNELAKRFAFIGTPNDIIEQAQEIFGSGANGIEFGNPRNLSSNNLGIPLLINKVFKYFRDKN